MTINQHRIVSVDWPGITVVESFSTFNLGKHSHDQYGIGLFDQGAHRSLSGRGTVEAEAGDIITVNPNEVHDGKSIGHKPRAWRMLYFDVALVASKIGNSRLSDTSYEFARPVCRITHLRSQIEALYRHLSADYNNEFDLWVDELLTLVFNALSSSPASAKAQLETSSQILRAIEQIKDDPIADCNLRTLSESVGLSEYQLIRGVSKATGFTPHALRIQCRIDFARSLLKQGYSIAAAASDTGFSDQSHFNRLFKRAYGYTPGHYLKAMQR